jgi:hypothetical protein
MFGPRNIGAGQRRAPTNVRANHLPTQYFAPARWHHPIHDHPEATLQLPAPLSAGG